MAGTGLFTAVNSTLWVALTDVNSGEAMLARCNGAAPTTANLFAEGCLMIRIDNGKLYSNQGTAAVPVWNSISDVTSSEIDEEIIQYAEVDITPANIIAMYTTPVVVVAAQAGKALEFISAVLIYD